MRQTLLLLMVVCSMSGWTSPALGEPSPTRIRQAQERLQQAGLDPGPADGVLGQRTAAALRQYQAAHSLPITGVLDDATRNVLMPAPAGFSSPAAPMPGIVPPQVVVPKLLPIPQHVLVPKPPDPVPIPPIVLPTPEDRERQREIQEVLQEPRLQQELEKTMKQEREKMWKDQERLQRVPSAPGYAPAGRGGGGRW